MKRKLVPILNLLSYIYLIIASFVFSAKEDMFDGKKINPVFMPASYAFSIWFLIYALLLVWIIRGFFCNEKEAQMYAKTVWWSVSCMILTGTSVLTKVNISPFVIVSSLIMAIMVYLTIEKSDVKKLYRVPFSFLASWLFVASIVDIVLVLKNIGVLEKFKIQETTLAIILIAVSAIIGIVLAFIKKDIIILAVLLWAYVAIAVQNKSLKGVFIMAIGTGTIILISMIYYLLENHKKRIFKK